MSATQRDVAARAGVSSIVVSHVLHNRAPSVRVSPATAERVRQAAKDLDYRVNVMARNFRSQQTRTIGVLHGLAHPNIRMDDRGGYLASLMQGLIEGAFGNDYSITLCPKLTGNDPIAAMCDGRFDGLVWYSTTQTSTYYKVIESCTVPLVVVHATPQDVNHARSTVICDNRQGIRLAIDHLFNLGHRRILFGLSQTHNPESYVRLRQFTELMAERGVRVDDEDVLDLTRDVNPAKSYFDRSFVHTAAICNTDEGAGEMLMAAQARGISVPEEFSFIGFDSAQYCNELRPRLTSVFQPISQLGRTAIDLLVEQMQHKDPKVRHEIVPCSLDIRESTATCPALCPI